jgi:hypothetical protein
MKIVIDHTRIGGIPVLECYPLDAPRPLPVIFIMHGYTGRKEDHLMQAYALARLGYCGVSMDLHLQGELGETPFDPAHVSPRFAEVIEQSTANLRTLITAYAGRSHADASRIGLMGISLGGAVIYHYLPTRAPAVQAAVSLIAGPAPVAETTFRLVRQYYPHFGVTDELIARLAEIGRTQPFLANVTDFPLLMQYGQADAIIPISEVRRLYQQVKEGYTQPEKIALVEYENSGHATPPAMFERAEAWFSRYLPA